MRKRTCAILPASMTSRSGVQVRILSERKSVDENAWAVTAIVKTVAPRHHVCTASHFTTRMITTGMWTRRMTMLYTHGTNAPPEDASVSAVEVSQMRNDEGGRTTYLYPDEGKMKHRIAEWVDLSPGTT